MKDNINLNKDLLSECAVFIRSTGERTEKVCEYSILQNGIVKENIFYIKNIFPFSKALRVGFEKAMNINKKYSIFIDADMILFPNSLISMLSPFELTPDNVFCIIPLSYTNFTGLISSGGPKIYKTFLLSKALGFVPSEKISLRPETYTFKAMQKIGYEFIFLDAPIAAQDFYQYNKDIFSKTINKYLKSSNSEFEKRINLLKDTDLDYKVASLAIEYIKNNEIELNLNANQFDKDFSRLNIEEKKAIFDIEKLYANFLEYIMKSKNDYSMDSYTLKWLNKNAEVTSLHKKFFISKYLKFTKNDKKIS